MSIKTFTTLAGFYLPVLKSLKSLESVNSINDIINFIKSNNFVIPTEADLDTIDFVGRSRFEYVLSHAVQRLIHEGLITYSNTTYKISETGLKKVDDEWETYHHENYIKNIDLINKNKYIYSNIPPYLFNVGHKKTTIYGFIDFENKYVKLLNDFLDYIDLNYPTIEEMADFLTHNYNFSSNSAGINAINVIRSCSLAKIIGKNLSLTKLGQWYINNYDSVALFRIFLGIYLGIEEMFVSIALNNGLSIQKLKQLLIENYDYNWIDSNQFDIRINWLENMKIIAINNSSITLTNEAIELAVFLGIASEEDFKPQAPVMEVPSDTNNTIEKDYDEIDDIIDDLISESNLFEDTDDQDDLFVDYSIVDTPSNIDVKPVSEKEDFEKGITLSQQERNYLLNNVDIENEMSGKEEFAVTNSFDDFNEITFDDISGSENSENVVMLNNNISDIEELDVEVPVTKSKDDNNNKKTSRVIQISKRKGSFEKIIYKEPEEPFDFQITPDEISSLVNLPVNVVSKLSSALNMGKHIILTGPHGSGKTSLAVILAKLAHQKGLSNGYNLTSANECWTSLDTIGGLININNETEKYFKEGFILKSIRENKWLIIDEISKCDTNKCFNDFINAFYDHNTILSYMHQNYKNIEILSEPSQKNLEINQYIKNKEWRLIATMDTHEKQHINFSSAFIRRFAFIEIGISNYSELIDKYFIQTSLQNDLLKTKIKSIFSPNGLLKYKEIGASSIHDLISYISIRSRILSEDESIQDILAEGLELYIIPQLQILDNKVVKEVEAYLMELFDGYEDIKKSISSTF